jgi:hypothetical protein
MDPPVEFVSTSGLIYRMVGNTREIFRDKVSMRLRLLLACAVWEVPMLCDFPIHKGVGDREVIDYSTMQVCASGDKVEIVSYS